jgi:hypothetical protein
MFLVRSAVKSLLVTGALLEIARRTFLPSASLIFLVIINVTGRVKWKILSVPDDAAANEKGD